MPPHLLSKPVASPLHGLRGYTMIQFGNRGGFVEGQLKGAIIHHVPAKLPQKNGLISGATRGKQRLTGEWQP